MNTEKSYDETYDSSWDEGSEELFDEKYAEWEKRDWESWLNQHLTFPFEVKRVEDEEFISSRKSEELFGIGHGMDALSIEEEDPDYGVIIKVRESGKTGYVPLCDVKVTAKENPNFWPVR